MITSKVRIKQAGGKYGAFTCPYCGGRCDYKFSGGSGWCNNCKSTFSDCGHKWTWDDSADKPHSDCWAILEVELSELASEIYYSTHHPPKANQPHLSANITAKNYVAQSERYLSQMYSEDRYGGSNFYGMVLNIIKRSIKFALPDGGLIFDDNLNGLQQTIVKLPFEKLCIEFWEPGVKNVIVAEQIDNDVFVTTMMQAEKQWLSVPVSVKIPNIDKFDVSNIDTTNFYFVYTLPQLYDSMTDHLKKKSDSLAIKGARHVFELLEALSCRNVTTEPLEKINPAKNAKRIKAGKLPIYETRVLTIKTNDTKRVSGIAGGPHASPRQHLRRGHIRRLENGNIWVNSCVVGDPTKGVINKQYAVV